MPDVFPYKGFVIKIVPDDTPINPRSDCDNLGTMICAHRRYSFGDKQVMPDVARPLVADVEKKGGVVSPLYMYDHSGQSFSLSNDHYPFNDRWDAGQLGYVYAEARKIRNWFGVKSITKELRQRVLEVFESELKDYQAYVNGEAVGYVVLKEGSTEVLDSCFGFLDDVLAMNTAKAWVDAETAKLGATDVQEKI